MDVSEQARQEAEVYEEYAEGAALIEEASYEEQLEELRLYYERRLNRIEETFDRALLGS